MGIRYLKNSIWVLPILFTFYAQAQRPNVDCRTAKVICSDTTFPFLPLGGGIDDFANPKNDQGCLQRRENISSWFYFEFRKDMPPNTKVWFSITDRVNQNCIQDFDFAIYPSDVNCDQLGKPIRCSFYQPPTSTLGAPIVGGMRPNETDTTETLSGPLVDGWLKPMTVQPGQGFFMLIDFFVGFCPGAFDSTKVKNYIFDWDGPAAPFLNCVANPNCDLVRLTTSNDTTVCAGSTLNLRGSATFTNKGEKYIWKAKGGVGASFVQANGRTDAVLKIPISFSGRLVYEFIVEEGNCIHSDSVVINVTPAPLVQLMADTFLCPNVSTNIVAPKGYAAYRWQDGKQGDTYLGARAGLFSVTVTTTDGCQAEASIQIRQKSVPNPLITGDSILCPGEITRLEVPLNLGTYSWSTGSAGNSTIVNAAGTYTITITDPEGCIIQGSKLVELKSNPPANITGPGFYCQGSNTILRGPAGNKFTYKWSSGTLTQENVISTPGPVNLTVTNEFGCTASSSFSVIERSNPAIQVGGDKFFCGNSSAVLIADPGFEAYLWSTKDTSRTININTPGTYRVSVTDGFGCQGIAAATIDTIPYPRPVIQGKTKLCSGERSNITPGSYSAYQWSNGSTNSSIPVTLPGKYSVIVTSANGCKGVDTIAVQVFSNPTPDIQGDLVLCPGETSFIGLSRPYLTYQWSNGSTNSSVLINQSGPLVVKVFDGNGCSAKDSVNVIRVANPLPSIQGLTQLCAGEKTMLSSVSGYQKYRWSTGDTLSEIQIATGGVYRLTVTDFNNCMKDTSLTVQLLANPKPEISGDKVICNGTRANLIGSPGFATYDWFNGRTSPTISVSSPGLYILVTTGVNGCINRDSLDLPLVTPKLPQGMGMEKILCRGNSVLLDSGSGFNSYKWSNGASSQTINVSKEGRYDVEVVDSNGCKSNTFYPVRPVNVDTPIISGPGEICEGQGVLLFSLNGSFKNYQWSTGATTAGINIRKGGLITLNTIDRNGCKAYAERVINEKPAPPISITGDLIICRNEKTILTASPGYSAYLWTNNNNDTARSIEVLSAGPYAVQVFGKNGCPGSAQVLVLQSKLPFPIIDGERFLCEKDTISLDVGTDFATYSWSTGETSSSINIIDKGIFGVTVTDSLNCVGNALITVFLKPAPPIEIISPDQICPGDTATIQTSTPFTAYQWSNGDTTQVIKTTQPGLYSLRVLGQNGCYNRDTFLLNQGQVPVFKFLGNPFFCAGGQTTLDISPKFEQYSWLDGYQGTTRVIDTAGTYYMRVANAGGCEQLDSIRVERFEIPIADAGPDTVLSCIWRSINLGTPISGQGQFVWTGPGINNVNQGQQMPNIALPGKYTLIVKDTLHGCNSPKDSVEVQDLSIYPEITVSGIGQLTCKIDTMRLIGSGNKVGNRYQYQWLDASGRDLLDEQTNQLVIRGEGKYTLQFIDTRSGCISLASYTAVRDIQKPVAAIYGVEPLSCVRDSVTLSVTQAPPDEIWTYRWERRNAIKTDTLTTEPRLTLGSIGTYLFYVKSEYNGCFAVDSVQIVKDTLAPAADAGPDRELDCSNPSIAIGSNNQTNANFRWFQIGNTFFTRKEAQPSVDEPGTYILEVENTKNGCRKTDTVVVTLFNNSPDSLEINVKHVSCALQKNGAIEVVDVNGGEGPFLYRLGKQGTFGTSTVFKNLQDGNYVVAVQDVRGCEWNQVVTINPGVEADLQVTAPQFILRGRTVRLQSSSNLNPESVENFKWTASNPKTKLTCDTCRSFKIQLFETTDFTAVIADTNGCTALATTTVTVDPNPSFYVPNAFSPNGDNINDTFDVKAGPDIEKVIIFEVYDRWGNKMYSRENFNPHLVKSHGWDGIHKGQKMEPAVFAWYIKVMGVDGVEFFEEGDVSLIR
jgi:gliding motility-associated-like protein